MSGRGDGTIIAPAPRPRSGLGLNELLGNRLNVCWKRRGRVPLCLLQIFWHVAAIPSAIEMGKDVPEINAEFRFTVFWIFVGISQKRLEMLLGVR